MPLGSVAATLQHELTPMGRQLLSAHKRVSQAPSAVTCSRPHVRWRMTTVAQVWVRYHSVEQVLFPGVTDSQCHQNVALCLRVTVHSHLCPHSLELLGLDQCRSTCASTKTQGS